MILRRHFIRRAEKFTWPLNPFLSLNIGAGLRPPGPPAFRELGHFLPAWMVTRKHRDEVVRGLRRLLRRAEALPAG